MPKEILIEVHFQQVIRRLFFFDTQTPNDIKNYVYNHIKEVLPYMVSYEMKIQYFTKNLLKYKNQQLKQLLKQTYEHVVSIQFEQPTIKQLNESNMSQSSIIDKIQNVSQEDNTI
ncbi:Hypothetical_protein [Hexamita inflata]|uniref:Hypothetical_protein n=1 Tax=Hexamita inflata TaxID=28002 RepID=A0ABP1GEP6_9EUKA